MMGRLHGAWDRRLFTSFEYVIKMMYETSFIWDVVCVEKTSRHLVQNDVQLARDLHSRMTAQYDRCVPRKYLNTSRAKGVCAGMHHIKRFYGLSVAGLTVLCNLFIFG